METFEFYATDISLAIKISNHISTTQKTFEPEYTNDTHAQGRDSSLVV